MHSPMSFFETTPQGRIMNRFSKDISGIDDVVPQTLMMFLRTFFSVIGAIFTITYATPIFLVVILPLLALYVFVQVRVVLFCKLFICESIFFFKYFLVFIFKRMKEKNSFHCGAALVGDK